MLTPPTPKVRVTVPVSLEVLARFKRLSEVSGQSVGRAMSEWLEGTQEGLDPMIAILAEHKARPAAAIRQLQDYAHTLDNITGDLFERVRNLDGNDKGQLAALAADAIGVAESIRKQGLTPPSSNTGGKGTKQPKRSIGGSK